jgi:chromate transporter
MGELPALAGLFLKLGSIAFGGPGLLVAGSCFILPATLIVGALAWVYGKFGKLPPAEGLLSGVKPVIIAAVVQALWRLGQTAVKNWPLSILGAAAATCCWRFGAPTLSNGGSG